MCVMAVKQLSGCVSLLLELCFCLKHMFSSFKPRTLFLLHCITGPVTDYRLSTFQQVIPCRLLGEQLKFVVHYTNDARLQVEHSYMLSRG